LHSDYAISKYGAEMEVWRGQQEGLQVVIVNPGIILGPGFWNQGSGTLFDTIKKGISFYTNGSTGYVAVTDVVKIMHLLLQSDCSGERFTLVAENISYKEIIIKIANKINAQLPKIEAKPWLLNLIWKADWLSAIVFRTKRKISKHGVLSLQNNDLISNEKLKTYLKYDFEEIDAYLNQIALYYHSKI
jgi:dihydroflavonol-4-reductase